MMYFIYISFAYTSPLHRRQNNPSGMLSAMDITLKQGNVEPADVISWKRRIGIYCKKQYRTNESCTPTSPQAVFRTDSSCVSYRQYARVIPKGDVTSTCRSLIFSWITLNTVHYIGCMTWRFRHPCGLFPGAQMRWLADEYLGVGKQNNMHDDQPGMSEAGYRQPTAFFPRVLFS